MKTQKITTGPPLLTALSALLESPIFIAITAVSHGRVIGGLAAYELPKFEQERNEIFIYDLAVDKEHRRKGVASGLIKKLQGVAAERGAHVIFVQADPDDEPAVLLYERFGRKQKVYHFDLVTSER